MQLLLIELQVIIAATTVIITTCLAISLVEIRLRLREQIFYSSIMSHSSSSRYFLASSSFFWPCFVDCENEGIMVSITVQLKAHPGPLTENSSCFLLYRFLDWSNSLTNSIIMSALVSLMHHLSHH